MYSCRARASTLLKAPKVARRARSDDRVLRVVVLRGTVATIGLELVSCSTYAAVTNIALPDLKTFRM